MLDGGNKRNHGRTCVLSMQGKVGFSGSNKRRKFRDVLFTFLYLRWLTLLIVCDLLLLLLSLTLFNDKKAFI